MASVPMDDYQLDAIKKMHNGCILCGGVGSGKSRTSLAYYYAQNGGDLYDTSDKLSRMKNPPDLYIITTAKKRDSLEWEQELGIWLLSTHEEVNSYKNKVVVDSWNNIDHYAFVQNSFFIFDEQRVVGYGKWAQTFINIARHNKWILLSATPGDSWMDYMAVFIANGFYRNKTDFINQHVVYDWRVKNFPKIDHYMDEYRLEMYKNRLLVNMYFKRNTIPHHEIIMVDYDVEKYRKVVKDRFNPYTDSPIINASEFCSVLRRITNEDESRSVKLLELFESHPKIIIFYNYDYELEILRGLYYGEDVEVAEWNGHKHQQVPTGDSWVYLVQYSAGSEGWNCITTDTIVFYSQSYSYKATIQAAGRTDRRNTPFTDLYYYHFRSTSSIDIAISRTLNNKKDFNEGTFFKKFARQERIDNYGSLSSWN